jgi:hypothetical protein
VGGLAETLKNEWVKRVGVPFLEKTESNNPILDGSK